MVSTASLFSAPHLKDVVENKPASSLVVSLGKALNGTPPPLCRKQVAQTPRKWQLPSECGRPVQNIAMQFASREWKINMDNTLHYIILHYNILHTLLACGFHESISKMFCFQLPNNTNEDESSSLVH